MRRFEATGLAVRVVIPRTRVIFCAGISDVLNEDVIRNYAASGTMQTSRIVALAGECSVAKALWATFGGIIDSPATNS